MPECPRTYFKLTALKAHMYRDHKADGPLRNSQQPLCDTPVQCDFCSVRCESSFLVCHLRTHLREGLQVRCPFRGCDSKFTVVSSFAYHISMKHKNESVRSCQSTWLFKKETYDYSSLSNSERLFCLITDPPQIKCNSFSCATSRPLNILG